MSDILRIIGDSHGAYNWYKNTITEANGEGIRTFHVGDFGIGFPQCDDSYWMEDPDNLAIMNSAIGGNHDNPLHVKECPLFLPRYGGDRKMFWVHGAASIDKDWRTPGVDWWDKEELTHYEMELCEGAYKEAMPRVMITHDAPVEALKYMFPYEMGNPDIPVSRTQQFLQYLFEIHRPDFWFFGHWHQTIRVEHEGCVFQCVGERHTVDFDFDKMEII